MTYKSEKLGYRIVTREVFFAGPDLDFYRGANLPTEQIQELYAEEAAKLRERAAEFPGTHVVYDPDDDADGWLLVGDDPAELDRETVAQHNWN